MGVDEETVELKIRPIEVCCFKRFCVDAVSVLRGSARCLSSAQLIRRLLNGLRAIAPSTRAPLTLLTINMTQIFLASHIAWLSLSVRLQSHRRRVLEMSAQIHTCSAI